MLLAGAPADETLTAYSLAVVHEAIRARGLFPLSDGQVSDHRASTGPGAFLSAVFIP